MSGEFLNDRGEWHFLDHVEARQLVSRKRQARLAKKAKKARRPFRVAMPFWVYRMRKMKCMRVVVAPSSSKPQVAAQMVVALAA
jgi:hypothetical protein